MLATLTHLLTVHALHVLTVAVVVDDRAALRAAPHDTAPRSVALWRGDWLEVRGEHAGFLQVYDHRHERPGYVRPQHVRTHVLDDKAAPELAAIVDFVKDAAGSESLGIGYVALYLKAAPGVPTAMLDALGTMAERLARRASATVEAPGSALPAHLEVAQSYGVHFLTREVEGRTSTCYDGDAFRRVLALGGTPEERQRAALALTAAACGAGVLDGGSAKQDGARLKLDGGSAAGAPSPGERHAWNEWRLDVVRRADTTRLPAWRAGPLRLREAEVLAELSYERARAGDSDGAARAGEEAVRALAGVERAQLADEDGASYERTALRVGAVRWAAEPASSPPGGTASARGSDGTLVLALTPGRPGETCVELSRSALVKPVHNRSNLSRTGQTSARAVAAPGGGGAESIAPSLLLRRCTFGVVWRASLRVASHGQAAAIAVQPLAGWTELWLLHPQPLHSEPAGVPAVENQPWTVDPLLPAATDPELGYVELAGFTPDGARALVVREALVKGALERQFQVLRLDTLAVEHHARDPEQLAAFRRWASADWRGRTIAVR